jgi:hypothetical protein
METFWHDAKLLIVVSIFPRRTSLYYLIRQLEDLCQAIDVTELMAAVMAAVICCSHTLGLLNKASLCFMSSRRC